MQVPSNPYIHSGPIRDQRYFHNREEVTRQVLESIGGGQCVSLVGPRKIGKTSLLFHVQSLSDAQPSGENGNPACVYVDGQFHRQTQPSELYSEFLEKICRVMARGERPTLPAERPREKMRQVVQSLILQGIRPVLLIDEFDILCENHNLDMAFFDGLRSLATLGVSYVTASKRRIFQLNLDKKTLGSPFFNYFRSQHVGLFDEESALKLIREPSAECGVHFDEQTVEEILHLAGKHPFFLQRACHIAFEMYRVQGGALGKSDIEQMRAESRQELEDHMASYWEDLGSEEQTVLFRVATDEVSQQDSEVTLGNLVRQSLLVRSDGDYQVFSPLFKDYVRAQPHPKFLLLRKWLDRFELKEELTRKERSVVYKAYQPALGRDVVIKELKPQTDLLDEEIERFRKEARSIASLDHPNILQVYDFFQEVDRAYIVMQYASRGSLADQLEEAQGPLDPIRAGEIVACVGRALEHAHRQGVVHRDIKPDNIFMGDDDWPLLGDFGLSLRRGEVTDEGPTMTGPLDYSSPEQVVDAGKADRLSDIYSLGVVLYRLLVGEVPYAQEDNAGDRLVKCLTEGVPAPRLRNPEVPVAMERIVLKATKPNPQDRYQTAEDMVGEIEDALWELVGVPEDVPEDSVEETTADGVPVAGKTPEPALERKGEFTRLLISALVVVVIFTATVTVLVWAAQRVPLVALAFILVVALVFDLVSIVAVLVLTGVVRREQAIGFFQAVLDKVPMLELQIHPQGEPISEGSQESPGPEGQTDQGEGEESSSDLHSLS